MGDVDLAGGRCRGRCERGHGYLGGDQEELVSYCFGHISGCPDIRAEKGDRGR